MLEDTSWEDNTELMKLFPSLHLVDKLEFQGSGHVTIEVDTNLILEDLRQVADLLDSPEVETSEGIVEVVEKREYNG